MSGFVIAVDGPAASGKGTIATRLGAALRPAGAGHRPALPRRGRDAAAARAATWATRRRPPRRRGRLDAGAAWTIRPCAPARPARRPAGWPPTRRCARRCCDFQRAFAAPARRRGDRRARHRHGDRPGRAGQAVRHRQPGGARRPPLAAARGRGRARDLRRGAGGHPSAATSATPAAPPRPCGRPTTPSCSTPREMTIDAAADAARRIVEAARARWETIPLRANPTAPYPRSPRATTPTPNSARRPSAQTPPTTFPGRRPAAHSRARPARPVQDDENEDYMADDMSMNPTRDDFAALLDESLGRRRLPGRHRGQGPWWRRSRRTSRSSTWA